MNKVSNIIFAIILFLFININVSAQNYICHYKTQTTKTSFGEEVYEGSFEIKDNKIVTSSVVPGWDAPVVIDSYINPEYTDEYTINLLNGNCPEDVYVCKGQTPHMGTSYYEKLFIMLNTSLRNSELETLSNGFATIDGFVFSPENDCYAAKYSKENSTAPSKKMSFNCKKYIDLYSIMKRDYCVSGSQGCNADKKKNYNESKDKLKGYCNTILQYSDSIDSCVDSCLNLKDAISELEGTTPELGECGFSDKLVGFILNIIKWIKYIIPAIVIILSIIDFIKAMAGDKDDEMKKAQSKFIKRLIAAALIFIVPLILEFVLDKMGFAEHIKGCGIIDF